LNRVVQRMLDLSRSRGTEAYPARLTVGLPTRAQRGVVTPAAGLVRRRRDEVAGAHAGGTLQDRGARGVQLLVRTGRAHARRGLGEVERDPLGTAETEHVAAGQRVDRELEVLLDAGLRPGPAGLVVEDLDAAGWQPVDAVDAGGSFADPPRELATVIVPQPTHRCIVALRE